MAKLEDSFDAIKNRSINPVERLILENQMAIMLGLITLLSENHVSVAKDLMTIGETIREMLVRGYA